MPGLYAGLSLYSTSKAARGASASNLTHASKLQKKKDEEPSQHPRRLGRLSPGFDSSVIFPSQTRDFFEVIRPKQVTDRLTETMRKKLWENDIYEEGISVNYGNNGSQDEPNTLCLIAMVHEFIENRQDVGSCGHAGSYCGDGACDGEVCCYDGGEDKSIVDGRFSEVLQGLFSCTSAMELLLLADVANALELVDISTNSVCKVEGVTYMYGCLRLAVLRYLRHVGYNAAICKSTWDHTRRLPAGDYEYIDVVIDERDDKRDRIIVDINFKAQFEIARASTHYGTLLQLVPTVFVGRPERLLQILKVMTDAAKLSLKQGGIYTPPWRKQRYMQAKWFSACKRSAHEEPHAHQAPKEPIQTEFSSTPLTRRPGFSSKHAIQMELYYHTASTESCKANVISNERDRDQTLQSHDGLPNLARRREVTLEGLANHECLDKIVVTCSDWRLPTTNPCQNPRPRQVVSGLACAVRKCGLNTDMK